MAKVAFKEGKPSDFELDELAGKISAKWETLGIHLGLIQDVLDEIAANAKKKPYEMLLRWKRTTTSLSPYEDLHKALCHVRVGLNNVAREFCWHEEDSTDSMTDCSRDSSNECEKAPIAAKRNVKPGTPDDDELHDLANDVSPFWKKLGRAFKIKESKLSQLDVNHQQDAYEKAYQMLLHWRETRNDQATYQILYNALTSTVNSLPATFPGKFTHSFRQSITCSLSLQSQLTHLAFVLLAGCWPLRLISSVDSDQYASGVDWWVL